MTAWYDDSLDADFDASYDADLSGLDAFAGDGADLEGFTLDGGSAPGNTIGGSVDADRVEALVSEATGVRFSSLVMFAGPLLDRYGVEATEAFDLAVSPADADETVVTLLETARVLWAFFSLDAADRDAQRGALLHHCYGPDADAEAWDDFADLLTAMEESWDVMSAAERADAESVDAAVLDLEALLDASLDAAFDPGRECDARALFALPLLDDPAVQSDPARFEAALHRADTYWTLAQHADRADRLAAVLPTLAETPSDVPSLRAEAEQMLKRYDNLFGN